MEASFRSHLPIIIIDLESSEPHSQNLDGINWEPSQKLQKTHNAMEQTQERSSRASDDSNYSAFISEVDIMITSKTEFNKARRERKLSQKNQSKEPSQLKSESMKINKEAVITKLQESKLFQSSKSIDLKSFVRNTKQSTGMNPGRIEEEIKIIKSSTKTNKDSSDKEQKLVEEYGVGFGILKKNGFNFGMGLGRNEQGDPNILQVKYKIFLGTESETIPQEWYCNNCQYMNESFRLNCLNCCAERSFHLQDMEIDY